MIIRAWLAAGGLLVSGSVLEAQDLRAFTAFRQAHNEKHITATVSLVDGSYRVLPGDPKELYRLELMYDEDGPEPVSYFDSAANSLVLGLLEHSDSVIATHGGHRAGYGDTHRPSSANMRISRVKIKSNSITITSGGERGASGTLRLSPNVDAELDFTIAGGKADLELGGLRVAELDVQGGVGDITLRFSKPNGIACRELTVTGGAGQFSLLGLGNSRCRSIEFQGAAGEAVLDLSGTWTADASVSASIAAGVLKLKIPEELGVEIRRDKFLAALDLNGFIKDGDRYRSVNYERTGRKVDIDLDAVLGVVTVEWIAE